MASNTEIMLETLLLTMVHVAAVYMAAFTYKLNWAGVMSVMVAVSIFTAMISDSLVSKEIAGGPRSFGSFLRADGARMLGLGMISFIAVLVILTRRFNFPQAVGISLVSGVLTSVIRFMMRMA
jgi:hypothetical protein